MDFSIPDSLNSLGARVRAFIEDVVIPFEGDPRWSDHGPSDELRLQLNELARQRGLLGPHVSKEYGGLALSHVGRAVVFEAAGYSMLGPIALHCAAPDEGNMHLMEVVATPAQKERWLQPLATARTRSCFAMTEPFGSGSDPSLLKTTATPDGDGFRINGNKWLITGAKGAAFTIVMAKISGGAHDGQATMFLADMDQPAISIERALDTLDGSFTGGHAAVRFEDLYVPTSDILGEVGQGLQYAQVRLAPARLTHCMRWLGSAVRAHDIATNYARTRRAFGKALGEHEGVSFMLADNEMDIHTARLVIWHTAWLLDQGNRASSESSMAKVICSEAIFRIADRCVQILGGLGVTRDTVVERIFRETRSFRIYDGPSEVHRWAIGRRLLGRVKSEASAS
jgi:alkylation response protein AidB-like acyl-CoA dehydrogenase